MIKIKEKMNKKKIIVVLLILAIALSVCSVLISSDWGFKPDSTGYVINANQANVGLSIVKNLEVDNEAG